MEYRFQEIEARWRQRWDAEKTFKAEQNSSRPKYYVLDMFPYPSGAGLHVGHPLGYIASDIISRYKKHKGFNVLHPMGFDAFGLPAEQYAIQTGRHPADTTAENISRYIHQLKNIGFAYDWDRMVNTSDPSYYRWTQWIFLQLFHHWYDPETQKAKPVTELIARFEINGNAGLEEAVISGNVEPVLHHFSAAEWKGFSEATKSDILMCYRLAYQSFAYVNWCEALGTVLANDEVKDGLSERGGHPVERRRMRQWFMRITAYADRLFEDLNELDWSDSMKEMQRNWIGKSEGALVRFTIENTEEWLEVFTTRPDTIFGVSFLVLAPESEWVQVLTTPDRKDEIEKYVKEASNRSERERQTEVKRVSGIFTGSYAIHPFTGKRIPVWIGDYVLAGYGTGVVMAVPAHDARDFRFARHFNLPVTRVIVTDMTDMDRELNEAWEAKEGVLVNSDFLNGLSVKDAIRKAITEAENRRIGQRRVNYRLRDANFSRQRYWGEPFPIYYIDGIAHPLPESALPLELPTMEDFRPTGKPEGPLAKLSDWKWNGHPLETDTMPGFAGSSWYFLRYMDPFNHSAFATPEELNYWKDVDLYIGGTEHAVGHLLYSRFWHKFFYDLGLVPVKEPFQKLVNQGMIQGTSAFVYRVKGSNTIVSFGLKDAYETTALHVDVNIVKNSVVDIERLKAFHEDFRNAEYLLENGELICGHEVEKMSKSKYNVVNPDDIVEQYGADTLRMYEMFLGPVEQSKPWNTNGIEGVHRFLKKLWNLFYSEGQLNISDEPASKAELKALHKCIQRVSYDLEHFGFNTCVSTFMICVNELTDLKCRKREILEPLIVLLSPFAPHIAEELWFNCGHTGGVSAVPYPEFRPECLEEDTFNYPVSFNGKTRFQAEFSVTESVDSIQQSILADERTARWLEGKTPKKVIIVPKKIINIVL